MERAPFYDDVADGPAGGSASWLTTSDGVRIRIGYWPQEGARGTVLLFPGRTEYVEKYGRAARDLAQRGYGTLVIDWRGQGLSDRLLADAMPGHVHHFSDYQMDIEALMQAIAGMDLPRPLHLLAHSMGGATGLRAAMEGLDVASAVFSGPMWGIQIKAAMRPVAWSLSWSSSRMGLGRFHAPGSYRDSYILREPFETNKLTSDPEMYEYMQGQLRAYPELALGGPSLRWLHEALLECLTLSRLPAPDLPSLTVVGTAEEIVCLDRIRARVQGWPGAEIEWAENGRHEVLMELPGMRSALFDRICDFYDRHGVRDHAPPPAAAAPAR